jgi:hypothetical protein
MCTHHTHHTAYARRQQLNHRPLATTAYGTLERHSQEDSALLQLLDVYKSYITN